MKKIRYAQGMIHDQHYNFFQLYGYDRNPPQKKIFSPKSHILYSNYTYCNEVWYSLFWLEGPKKSSTLQFWSQILLLGTSRGSAWVFRFSFPISSAESAKIHVFAQNFQPLRFLSAGWIKEIVMSIQKCFTRGLH